MEERVGGGVKVKTKLNDFEQLGQFNYGEDLVAIIFSFLVKSGELKAYKFDSGKKKWKKVDVKEFIIQEPIETNREIYINSKIKANKLQRIDLPLLYKNSVFPVEIKLGRSNKTKNFPADFNRFLTGKSISIYEKTHLISGGMIKILEERKIKDTHKRLNLLCKILNKNLKLTKKWGIVIRNESFNNPTSKGKFKNLKYVFIFDELLDSIQNKATLKKEIKKSFAKHLSRKF